MKVVFDTNVLVAGVVAERLCREIVETYVPDHTPILSSVLWHEDVLVQVELRFGSPCPVVNSRCSMV